MIIKLLTTKRLILLLMIGVMLLSACSISNSENNIESDIQYKLKTGRSNGDLVFIGVGGEIDGQINPQMMASPGDIVEITLLNDDGLNHDIIFPDFNAATREFSKRGQEEKIQFTVDMEGTFVYYCSVPGHRQAGMEGEFIVGSISGSVDDNNIPEVSHSPDDLPGLLDREEAATIRVDLETKEVVARLDDGSSFEFWTFNGVVPGPFIRVRVGDTVEVFLKNADDSQFLHSIDFHAATGPGGGAVATQTHPGEETSFSFKALNPGLYVYHCATPMVAHHIANGMYGLILVEPEVGLLPVDHEYYVMQGELYTAEEFGTEGLNSFSVEKLLDEQPEYLIFNGSVDSLTSQTPLLANVGETIRIYFGVGGPNLTSSFHVIGENFDRVFNQGSLTSEPLTNVQTTLVPPGGAVMVEFTVDVPGNYLLVDHALSRLERGLVGYLIVDGPENPAIFDAHSSEDDEY